MDGFQVMTGLEAAAQGEVFITVSGGWHVIGADHFAAMRSGAIVANSGHFNVEIDIPALEAIAVSHREVRPFVEEYVTADGRRIYLLGEGRLINLTAAEGHPSAVMGYELRQPGFELRIPGKALPRTGIRRPHGPARNRCGRLAA